MRFLWRRRPRFWFRLGLMSRGFALPLPPFYKRSSGAQIPVLPGMSLPASPELTPMDQASTARCLCLLTCAPNGLQELSQDMPGLPQTSLNLGVLTTLRNLWTLFLPAQQPRQSEGDATAPPERLDPPLGGSIEVRGDYPGMGIPGGVSPAGPAGGSLSGAVRKRPQHRSHPRGTGMRRSLKKYRGWTACPLVPIFQTFTPRERMEVASVQRVWKLLLEVLRLSR